MILLEIKNVEVYETVTTSTDKGMLTEQRIDDVMLFLDDERIDDMPAARFKEYVINQILTKYESR